MHHLAKCFESIGVRADVQRFGASRGNVPARMPGAGDYSSLMFGGHLDTSGYGDAALDFPLNGPIGPTDLPRPFVEDGIMFGLGALNALNMRGGVAGAAEALTALAKLEAAPRNDVLFGAVTGESEQAPVRGALCSFEGADYEGSGAGAKGPRYPGISAIEVAFAVVQALNAWEPRYREAYRLDCSMGVIYPNVTAGAIEGGWPFKPDHVPGVCNLYVDLGVPPQLDAEACAAVETIPGARYTLEVFANNTPGALIPFEHGLVQRTRAARPAVLGDAQERHPDEELVRGDDGKVFARLGILYVKCGPSGLAKVTQARRHGREWIEIAQLVQAARTYVRRAPDL
jgi:acetylornithine deacetylase/succinyl-diaminopimelate desuccinylase-like protein